MCGVRTGVRRHERTALAAILVAGLLVRLPFAFADTRMSPDMAIFVDWARTIAGNGLVSMTDAVTVVVYPPLSMVLIGSAGVFASWVPTAWGLGDAPVVLLLKLPAIAADIGLAWLVTRMLSGRGTRLRLGAAALIVFNPALWYLSAIWGQTDSVYVLFAVAAIWALSRSEVRRSWVAYGVATAAKVQPLLLAPVMVIGSLRAGRPRELAMGILLWAGVVVALLLPWLIGGGTLTYLGKLWGVTSRLDDSATNLWYLLRLGDTSGLATVDGAAFGLPFPVSAIGYGMLAAVVVVVGGALWWRGRAVGLALPATILAMAPYLVLAGMRERYLLLALPLALLVAARWEDVTPVRGAWLCYFGLVSAQTVNLLAIASPAPSLWHGTFLAQEGPLAVPVQAVSMVAAAVNVAVFAWLLGSLVRNALGNRPREGQ